MGNLFSSLIGQFKEFHKSIGPTKRLALTVSFLIIIVAMGFVVFMASGKDYSVLLTNIPAEQVPNIVAKLQAKNVPFQLKDDSKTILVPNEFLHSTQMQLMAELGNSNMGSIGLELFDKQDFGINSYAQKVNYQRALQGELMRAINTLTAVKQSKVILALPQKKAVMEETIAPTASVIVVLNPGKELTSDQVKGIKFLVANAVEGLDAEKVTVIDDRGKLLSKKSDGGIGATSEILELKAQIEKDLEGRIDSILSKVVGSTKIVTRVDATINHKIVSAIEEIVDPDKTATRSITTNEESAVGARTNPAGAPGSRSNLPGAEDSAGQTGFKQDVNKETKTIQYDVAKTVRNIKEGAGGLEKISVAVLVDGFTTTKTDKDGKSETKWQPRSAEEMAKYESLVKSAIGFVAARGDSVKIESIQFQAEDFTESEKLLTNLEKKKLVQSLFKWGLLGFSLVLLFFMVVRPFMQWITDSVSDSVEEMLPRTIEELEELQSIDSSIPGLSNMLPMLQESIDPEKAESELLKDRIISLMALDEEKASSAINEWVSKKE
ncbi:MAG: flagellar M-ring protein FliF [Moraxellaceae bacterium]|nr:flagellar M-ring protein FliF [Pseudobdellovibrionaceae bacterium]